MKLNYKRTIFVGFAFFLISAFWQAYDAIVPLILTNHFGLSQDWSGAVMSLDNILAVFMLPLFGSLSDRCESSRGRRTPFVFFGTVAAVICFIVLTCVDNLQLARLAAEGVIGSEDAIARALELTLENPWTLISFLGALLLVLVAMATFRSPAVALMPDVTIKPLRSKGNAIINLMGAAGGILVLVLGMLFGTSKDKHMSYVWYVAAVVAIMLSGLLIFLFTVKEKKWAEEMEAETDRLGLREKESAASVDTSRKLSRAEIVSLLLILASVALWYVGYNSITSKYSVYATNELGFDFNFTLIIAQAAAIVSYIPVGIIASKIGRKKTILAGITMLAAAFLGGHFVTPETSELIMYPIFVLAGMGWATINVNSFPMVVELARGGDVGKYTGYYYTASMAAQIIAPIFSGKLYEAFGMRNVFFVFGTVFVAASFVTMFFVKHGDSRPEAQGALESLGANDD
ncbi:MAG: MFS transporter [Oscillospiraceae bacterium]|nr:MFS transporter [Oscillospiraceae bacterium]